MAAATETASPKLAAASATPSPRPTRPVIGFAVVGAGLLAVEAYALAAWVVSGDATPTPDGPTPIPGWMNFTAHFLEIFALASLATFLWFVVIKPWRRDRRLSTDGLFCLVFALIWWQDPMPNYFQAWFTYNTAFVNFGNWTTHLPGWISPNGNLVPFPILFSPATYVWVVFGGTLVAGRFLQWFKERRPLTNTTGLIFACLGFFVVFDFVVENAFTRLGMYSFPGAPEPLTLFAGHYYQFCVPEKLAFCVTWTMWTSLRYFRDDKGFTLAERGVDQVRTGGRKRTVLRFLALSGACNVIWLVGYNIPMAILGLYASPWPDDVTTRSYLTDGICGAGTAYACAGPGIPIPRPDSVRIGLDGRVAPPR